MLVGNDVIDLRDPENQPGAIHPRFDQRVFTPAERAGLTHQATAHRTRWLMWAAKESAFKVARKLDLGVRFLPRLFSVQLEGNPCSVVRHPVVRHAVVRHAAGRFTVSFSGADEWVHAIATPCDGPSFAMSRRPSAVVERLRGVGSAAEYASTRVRALARSAVGSVLSIAPVEIEIATSDGIPIALRRSLPLPIDLSLSHHGRFLAIAWSRSQAPGIRAPI